MEEETYQYYAIITDTDAAVKEEEPNVMYLTFEQEKLDNDINDPTTSNVEFINISVENDDSVDVKDEVVDENLVQCLEENNELKVDYFNNEDEILTSVDEIENEMNGEYKKIFLEDGTCAIIDEKVWNNLLENSKVRLSKKKEKAFSCTFEGCDKSYTASHHLTVHVRSHTGTRPFVCEVCKKSFMTAYSLKSHSRTHTGEKPYGCVVCSKHFKTSGDLQKHVRIHTGEKPFKCPVEGCDRSFTTSNIRKVHVRSHTGERPYVCKVPDCGKAFASTTNFKNHMRIHSGEKPYVCQVEGCNKRFTEYSSLYKHNSVHLSYKAYSCNYCDFQCKHESTLKTHKSFSHKVLVTADGTEIMVFTE